MAFTWILTGGGFLITNTESPNVGPTSRLKSQGSTPSSPQWQGSLLSGNFTPECSILGASEDNNLVDELLNEINEGDDIIGYRSLKAQLELRQESEKFVNEFWSAIEAVARALWATPEHTEGLQRARTGLVTVVDGKKTRWCALCRNSQALWDLPFDLG